jgi:hypothetical protein
VRQGSPVTRRRVQNARIQCLKHRVFTPSGYFLQSSVCAVRRAWSIFFEWHDVPTIYEHTACWGLLHLLITPSNLQLRRNRGPLFEVSQTHPRLLCKCPTPDQVDSLELHCINLFSSCAADSHVALAGIDFRQRNTRQRHPYLARLVAAKTKSQRCG